MLRGTAGALAAVLVAGVVAWHVPFLGQQRDSRPVAELLLPAPPFPGSWEGGGHLAAGTNTMWGLRDRLSTGWRLPDQSRVTETVRRFSSPTWAAVALRTDDWRDRYAKPEDGDRVVQREPLEVPGVDFAQYLCLEAHDLDVPGGTGCQRWLVRLRSGQYHIELYVELWPTSDNRIPGWLYRLVADAAGQLTTRAQRG